jgi:AcrR family transcriptional regulator
LKCIDRFEYTARVVDAPSGNRRERRRIELRERILDAARELFEERGYEETRVAEICERADVAYGTFFNHFPEKRDALRALADLSLREITERLEELGKQPGTIEDQLLALFAGSAGSLADPLPGRRDLAGRIHAIAYAEAPADRDRRYHSAFEAFLTEGVARGRVRRDVPVETLAEVVGATFAFVALGWIHFDDYPLRERAEAAARFLASALAPQAAAPGTGALPDFEVSP